MDIKEKITLIEELRSSYKVLDHKDGKVNTKWKFYCKGCEFVFEGKYTTIRRGTTPCNCSKNRRKSYEELKHRIESKQDYYTVVDNGARKTTDVWEVYCNICKNIFKSRYEGLSRGHKCCNCQQSRQFGKNYYEDKLKHMFSDKENLELISKADVIKNNRTLIEFRCNVHNEIFSRPLNKLLDKEPCCHICNRKGLYSDKFFSRNLKQSLETAGWVYLVKVKGKYKVGITKNPQRRFLYMKYSVGEDVEVIFIKQSDLYSCYTAEKFILSEYERVEIDKKFSGWTECISMSEQDIKEVITLLELRLMEVN